MFKTILVAEDNAPPLVTDSLQRNCRKLRRAESIEEAIAVISIVDAVVLHMPHDAMLRWQASVSAVRKLPQFWLCPDNAAPPEEIEWGFSLDGLLFGSMNDVEVGCALQWGGRIFHQRRRWTEERETLLQRLEERKWIDQAKAVLCEIKGISEAEAYDLLRKQAMNERKRIGDVASSIVKVYQLIHG